MKLTFIESLEYTEGGVNFRKEKFNDGKVLIVVSEWCGPCVKWKTIEQYYEGTQ